MRHVAKMPIKHETKPNALLASEQHAECFILHIGRARPCFNCFKEFTYECLVKAYPFQVSPDRQLRWLNYVTGIHHLVSLFTIRFSYLAVLYCNIALQMHFPCYMMNIALIFALILPHKFF